MSFPTTQIPTTNLDAASDSPSAARADLYEAVVNLNTIVAGAGSATGVALLDANGKIPSSKFPQSIAYTGVGPQYISPSSRIVNIQDIIRLTAQPKSDILNITTSTLETGDIAVSRDGNSGTVALCLFDGVRWLRLHAQTPLNSTTPVISGSISGASVGTGSGILSFTIGDTITGDAGTEAFVENIGTETEPILQFTIPAGAKGDTGAVASMPNIVIGSVGTGDVGTTATVEAVITGTDVILNFTIPKGDTGLQGVKGDTGASGSGLGVDGVATLSSLEFNGVVNTGVSLSGISGTSAQEIDSWSTTDTHSAKYYITVKDGSDYHVTELSVMTNGTDVFVSEYGIMVSNTLLGVASAKLNSTTVSVSFTPTGASNMAIIAAITRMTI